jgi:hypothetical protein
MLLRQTFAALEDCNAHATRSLVRVKDYKIRAFCIPEECELRRMRRIIGGDESRCAGMAAGRGSCGADAAQA